MALFGEALEGIKTQDSGRKAKEIGDEILLTVKDIMNNNLIPKYRKIVGKTVPDLE